MLWQHIIKMAKGHWGAEIDLGTVMISVMAKLSRDAIVRFNCNVMIREVVKLSSGTMLRCYCNVAISEVENVSRGTTYDKVLMHCHKVTKIMLRKLNKKYVTFINVFLQPCHHV